MLSQCCCKLRHSQRFLGQIRHIQLPQGWVPKKLWLIQTHNPSWHQHSVLHKELEKHKEKRRWETLTIKDRQLEKTWRKLVSTWLQLYGVTFWHIAHFIRGNHADAVGAPTHKVTKGAGAWAAFTASFVSIHAQCLDHVGVSSQRRLPLDIGRVREAQQWSLNIGRRTRHWWKEWETCHRCGLWK